MDSEVMWTLDQGVRLVRALQESSRKFGYHLTLGGGVVNKGSSSKDVDLFFLPLDNDKDVPDPDALLKWLEEMWGSSHNIRRDYRQHADSYLIPIYNSVGEFMGFQNTELASYLNTDLSVEEAKSIYKHKVKFIRNPDSDDHDRIDVFILAGADNGQRSQSTETQTVQEVQNTTNSFSLTDDIPF